MTRLETATIMAKSHMDFSECEIIQQVDLLYFEVYSSSSRHHSEVYTSFSSHHLLYSEVYSRSTCCILKFTAG